MDPKIIKGGTAAALPLGVTSKKSSEKELQSGASQLFYLSLYASKANIFITYVFRRTLLDIPYLTYTVGIDMGIPDFAGSRSILSLCMLLVEWLLQKCPCLAHPILLALRNRINDSVRACVASIYMH